MTTERAFGTLSWADAVPEHTIKKKVQRYRYTEKIGDDGLKYGEGEYYDELVDAVVGREPAHWVIKGEPQMRTRLKRLFARVDVAQIDKITISDTPENCLELLWFMERYPLTYSEQDGKRLKRGRTRFVDHRKRMADILSKDYKPPELKPLAYPLRPHQLVGRDAWLAQGAMLLGDPLGAGKTATSIGGMVLPQLLPAVVVVDTHLPRQWRDEGFGKFAPWLNVHIATKGTPYELPLFIDGQQLRRGTKRAASMFAKPCDVLIVTYSKLHGWAEFITKWAKSITYDDGHKVGVGGTLVYTAYCEINRKLKYCLNMTGTPIRNYGAEVFYLLDGLDEGCVGTREEFMREWPGELIGQNEIPTIDNIKGLSNALRERGLFLRRTPEECGMNLEEPQLIPVEIECDTSKLEAIKDEAARLAEIVLGLSGNGKGFEIMQASRELDMLARQATGIAKAPYIAEMAKMVLESEPKVMISIWHREVYAILTSLLKDYGVVEYSGEQSLPQKERSKKAFIEDPATRVMLISAGSGAGLDGCQRVCSTGIVGEWPWTYFAVLQFIGRMLRDGQPRHVKIYLPRTQDGSDPFVLGRVGIKREQLVHLNDPEAEDLKPIEHNPNHMKELAAHYLAKRGVKLPELAEAP
jgi:SNF2 family DNA or RNA helicase